MREIGIDLSMAIPQKLTAGLATGAEMLITMGCGEDCPFIAGIERDDWPLPDPKGKDIETVRFIRDEIVLRIRALVERKGLAR